jgi:DNA ligase-1
VEVLPGKGRNAGRMGALLLEMPSGQRFALGTGFSDALRESPPAVGATVTYRYLTARPQAFLNLQVTCGRVRLNKKSP